MEDVVARFVDTEIVAISVRGLEPLLRLGFRLIIFHFQHPDIQTLLSDNRIQFFQENIRIHMLIGVVVFSPFDSDGIDVLSGGELAYFTVVHVV